MLATIIESHVKEILKTKGNSGWLRVSTCAKLFSNGNKSQETRFYRWRKQVEDGKVSGFQVLKFPNNISFIGLDTANPNILKAEVGIMSTSSLVQTLSQNWLQRLGDLGEENAANSVVTMQKIGSFLMILPKEIRKSILPEYFKAKRNLIAEWKKMEKSYKSPTIITDATQTNHIIKLISDLIYQNIKNEN
jgi:hypothetical protein